METDDTNVFDQNGKDYKTLFDSSAFLNLISEISSRCIYDTFMLKTWVFPTC